MAIDTGIVQNFFGLNMQKHDDQHKLRSHPLDIHGSSNLELSLKVYSRTPDIPKLFWAPVTNVSTYIQKSPNVIGDSIPELDAHVAQAPMKLTTMGVDP